MLRVDINTSTNFIGDNDFDTIRESKESNEQHLSITKAKSDSACSTETAVTAEQASVLSEDD